MNYLTMNKPVAEWKKCVFSSNNNAHTHTHTPEQVPINLGTHLTGMQCARIAIDQNALLLWLILNEHNGLYFYRPMLAGFLLLTVNTDHYKLLVRRILLHNRTYSVCSSGIGSRLWSLLKGNCLFRHRSYKTDSNNSLPSSAALLQVLFLCVLGLKTCLPTVQTLIPLHTDPVHIACFVFCCISVRLKDASTVLVSP